MTPEESKGISVLRLADLGELVIGQLLARYQLRLVVCNAGDDIPGSFWGEPEAGLVGNTVYARADTPLHSVLHEACHFLCMTPTRRARLHTNAGGDYDEENCVCFMQVILADYIAGLGRDRMLADMDAWGYSFRLGSARAWFSEDAGEVSKELQYWGMLDANGLPTWQLRGAECSIEGMNQESKFA